MFIKYEFMKNKAFGARNPTRGPLQAAEHCDNLLNAEPLTTLVS